jgi:hypothetical protein
VDEAGTALSSGAGFVQLARMNTENVSNPTAKTLKVFETFRVFGPFITVLTQ